MRLHHLHIKNFRLLHEIDLFLEDDITVIVGRNNSGKTSLNELIRRFTAEKGLVFNLQDFSVECYEEIKAAYIAQMEGKPEVEVRNIIPCIELHMFFQYDPSDPTRGPLVDFIVDLDMNCKEALVVLRYEPSDGAISRLFEDLPGLEGSREADKAFFREIADRIHRTYSISVWAVDPNDAENRKATSQAAVRALLKTGFINAQRGLDDSTAKETDVLAKVLEELFSTASLETADAKERKIAQELETAVRSIQDSIDGDFRGQLNQLLPAINTFGYPGLGGPELTTETTLDVQRLLTNHTKVRYEGHNGVLLPESYNGLGMRNLIFILLQIVSFHREYRAHSHVPGVHLVFIEEPEAHLHPQMQEVFIRQIGTLVEILNQEYKDELSWPVQFVVSTHSSHIANEAHFEALRYFLPVSANTEETIWRTKVKDLRLGMSGVDTSDRDFLHQYLTLTRCDLFFADKAILIEGTSERLMLPVMIQKHDVGAPGGPQLRSQYMTIIEVGGAYAHKFFGLLQFLQLQTLVITDLDPIVQPGGKKCLVHEAKATSNACINSWFGGGPCVPNDLLGKPDGELTKDQIRIAFQCPERLNDPCGRTFEDAFILANMSRFGLAGESRDVQAAEAAKAAESVKKSEFALKYAIDDKTWVTPKYIQDGLTWLAKKSASPPSQTQLRPQLNLSVAVATSGSTSMDGTND